MDELLFSFSTEFIIFKYIQILSLTQDGVEIDELSIENRGYGDYISEDNLWGYKKDGDETGGNEDTEMKEVDEEELKNEDTEMKNEDTEMKDVLTNEGEKDLNEEADYKEQMDLEPVGREEDPKKPGGQRGKCDRPLPEFINTKNMRKRIRKNAAGENVADFFVKFRGYGEKLDISKQSKHKQGTEIKAITMHMMRVNFKNGGKDANDADADVEKTGKKPELKDVYVLVDI